MHWTLKPYPTGYTILSNLHYNDKIIQCYIDTICADLWYWIDIWRDIVLIPSLITH